MRRPFANLTVLDPASGSARIVGRVIDGPPGGRQTVSRMILEVVVGRRQSVFIRPVRVEKGHRAGHAGARLGAAKVAPFGTWNVALAPGEFAEN
ncbi:hypothetical protein GCM10010381_26220 [Streptomyces xantholiticus]|nr:hypothetical protein GCM10010381_26220 [Streptomyces xantholiticus]